MRILVFVAALMLLSPLAVNSGEQEFTEAEAMIIDSIRTYYWAQYRKRSKGYAQELKDMAGKKAKKDQYGSKYSMIPSAMAESSKRKPFHGYYFKLVESKISPPHIWAIPAKKTPQARFTFFSSKHFEVEHKEIKGKLPEKPDQTWTKYRIPKGAIWYDPGSDGELHYKEMQVRQAMVSYIIVQNMYFKFKSPKINKDGEKSFAKGIKAFLSEEHPDGEKNNWLPAAMVNATPESPYLGYWFADDPSLVKEARKHALYAFPAKGGVAYRMEFRGIFHEKRVPSGATVPDELDDTWDRMNDIEAREKILFKKYPPENQ